MILKKNPFSIRYNGETYDFSSKFSFKVIMNEIQ